MIDKEIIIITKGHLFELCQNFFYIGKSGQFTAIDIKYVLDELREVLK